MESNKNVLSSEQREELLSVLKARFEKNRNRHEGLDWAKVLAKLEADAEKLWSLHEMERTGGEPDVVGYDEKTDEEVAEVFAMTAKRLSREKSINPNIMRLIWQPLWVLSC